jgi:hypothetical protein
MMIMIDEDKDGCEWRIYNGTKCIIQGQRQIVKKFDKKNYG